MIRVIKAIVREFGGFLYSCSRPSRAVSFSVVIAAWPSVADARLERFAQELEAQPDRAVAHFNYGTALYEKGDMKAAEKAFLRAIRLSNDFHLSADAFYNLGILYYDKGRLATGEIAPELLAEEASQVFLQNMEPVQLGRQILEMYPTQPQPQQVIQYAIQSLEQRLSPTKESIDLLDVALKDEAGVQSAWVNSVNSFESALELFGKHSDASHNLQFAKRELARLNRSMEDQRAIRKRQERKLEEMERLIEELKKLLEDTPSEDPQDSDQQESEPKPPEDSSDSDGADSSEEGEEQTSADGDESVSDPDGEVTSEEGQDQPGDTTDSSDLSDTTDTESEETMESDDDSINGEVDEDGDFTEKQEEGAMESEVEEVGQEDERTPSPEVGDKTDDAESAGVEGDQVEEKAPEDTSDPTPATRESDEEEQTGEDGRPESVELTEDEVEEFEQRVAEDLAQEEEEVVDAEQREIMVPGVMSREEARRMLESLQNTERILPASRSGQQPPRRPDHRDW